MHIATVVVLGWVAAAEGEAPPAPSMVEVEDLMSEVSSDAPRRVPVGPEVRALGLDLQATLGDRRARLVAEERPTLQAPVAMMFVSGAALAASGVSFGLSRGVPSQASTLEPISAGALITHFALGIAGTVLLPLLIRATYVFDATPMGIDHEIAEVGSKLAEASMLEDDVARLRIRRAQVRYEELTLQRTRLLDSQPPLALANVFLGVGAGLCGASGLGWLSLGLATRGRFVDSSGWAGYALTALVWTLLVGSGVVGISFLIGGGARLERYHHIQDEIEGIDSKLESIDWKEPLPTNASPLEDPQQR